MTGKRRYVKRERAKQAGTLVGVRLQPDLLRRVDATRGERSRPETIRELIGLGLTYGRDGQ